MMELLGATLVFVGGHFILSTDPLRSRLIAFMGEWFFWGLYSLVSLLALWWMLTAYGAAPKPELWQPHMAFRHIAVSVMPLVCILLIAGYTSANPSAIGFSVFKGLEQGPHGVFRVTRHPIMWGVALWALAHLLANASTADFVLFGSMAFLSIAGTWHIDRRKSLEPGSEWAAYCAETSSIPFVAILDGRQRFVVSEIRLWRIIVGFLLYFGMLMAHQTITGSSPLPMP
ncbi:MAG: NnrU protein [Rhodospirillales bacterium]|nr:NnrU protein [Rhodospirillales bacterium]